jgi:hypothetical protein
MIEPWDRKGRQICLRAITRAGDELNDLTDRIAGGRRKLHAQNKPMNTTPCYGILYRDKYNRDESGKAQYFYEDMTPAIDGLSKREVVAMVFDWRYRQGWRVGSIVTGLNKRRILSSGYKAKGGVWVPPGPWTRATVLQLLRNRKYIGEHWEGGKRVHCPCPCFVDREVFEAVQKMTRAKKPGRPPAKRLLCGYLECGPCQHKYQTLTGGGRRVAYLCGRKNRQRQFLCKANSQVPCHILDEVVFRAVWRHLTDAALFLRNVRAYYDSLPGKSEVIAMEKELATLAAKVSRLEDQIDQGAGDHQKAIARILACQTRMKELKTALKSAGSVATLPDEHVMRAALAEVANPDDEPESFEERRPILESLANLKMVYDKGHVEITGSVPVASCAHKCRGRFTDPSNSVQYIPFKIKARVA